MKIILRRSFAYLLKDFETVFRDHDDVRIRMDRRYDDRRSESQPVLFERRLAERRREHEPLAEVVV